MASRFTAAFVLFVTALSGYLGYKILHSPPDAPLRLGADVTGADISTLVPSAQDSASSQFVVLVLGASFGMMN